MISSVMALLLTAHYFTRISVWMAFRPHPSVGRDRGRFLQQATRQERLEPGTGGSSAALTAILSHACSTAHARATASSKQRGLRLLLRREDLADHPDHQQFEQIDEASGEYVNEQLFHDRQIRSRR